ncbi:MAG TPA: dihydroneopterin aldolase [Eubacteriaceae bacterium]|nr:dihydroneopterin aldolase [Eubacteriaceae bacterium]
MDKIMMKGMAFFGYHGVMGEEKALGQKFIVDASLSADLKQAGASDDLTQTINYGLVYDEIKDVVENEQFDLLEALGETICRRLFEEFPLIKKIKILIKKPAAPVQGVFDYMAVEIKRKREES